MLGRIEFIKLVILFIAVIATATDLFFGKIYNWITVPALILGILSSYYCAGWSGIAQAGLGVLAGLLLYGWLFGLRVMGGGDVKLLMALGALAGPEYAISVGVLGILLGGVLAAFLLTVTGRWVGFIRRLNYFLLALFLKELEFEKPKIDRSFTMPFGIPIAVAAIWILFSNPFMNDTPGVHLWGSGADFPFFRFLWH